MLENYKFLSNTQIAKISGKTFVLRVDFSFFDLHEELYLAVIKNLLKNKNQILFLYTLRDDSFSIRKIKRSFKKQLKQDGKILKNLNKAFTQNDKYAIYFYELNNADDLNLDKDLAEKLASLSDYYCLLSIDLLDDLRTSLDMVAFYKTLYYLEPVKFYIKGIDKFQKSLFPKDSLILLGGKLNFWLIENLKAITASFDNILLSAEWAYYLWINKNKKNPSALAKKLLAWEKKYSSRIVYPLDYVVLREEKGKYKIDLLKLIEIKKGDLLIDIGPETIRYYSLLFREHDYLLYNNLLAQKHHKELSHSDKILLRAFANRAKGKSYGIALGSDLTKFLQENDLASWIDLIITREDAFYRVMKDLREKK